MRLVCLALLALLLNPQAASAQNRADIARGIIGGIVGQMIEQGLNEAAQGGTGGQTMNGLTCPGQWVQQGQGTMCLCPSGLYANYEGGQVICPDPEGEDRQAAPQLTEAERQEQAEQVRQRKDYTLKRRKCLDKGELEACQQALTFPGAREKERQAMVKKVKGIEERLRLALEQVQKAQALAQEKQRQAALAEQAKTERAAHQAQEAAELKQPLATGAAQTAEQKIADAATQSPSVPEQPVRFEIEQYHGPVFRVDGLQPVPEATGEHAQYVRDRLKTEIDHLAAQGFQPTPAEAVREIAKDKPESLRVGLTMGTEYAFIATCTGCSKVELSLRDPSHIELARSPENAETVILNGAAPVTGEFEIAVGVPGCSTERCFGGMTVLQKGAKPPANPIETSALPEREKADQTANAGADQIAKVVQEGLSRVGCYRGAADGNWGAKSIAALAKFNQMTKLALNTNTPDAEAGAALALYKSRVCPLECENNQIQKDGACVRKSIAKNDGGRRPKPELSAEQAFGIH